MACIRVTFDEAARAAGVLIACEGLEGSHTATHDPDRRRAPQGDRRAAAGADARALALAGNAAEREFLQRRLPG